MTFLWPLVTRSYLAQVQGLSRAKPVEAWLAKVDVYSSHETDNWLGPKNHFPPRGSEHPAFTEHWPHARLHSKCVQYCEKGKNSSFPPLELLASRITKWTRDRLTREKSNLILCSWEPHIHESFGKRKEKLKSMWHRELRPRQAARDFSGSSQEASRAGVGNQPCRVSSALTSQARGSRHREVTQLARVPRMEGKHGRPSGRHPLPWPPSSLASGCVWRFPQVKQDFIGQSESFRDW